MTVRDTQVDFAYKPPTASSAEAISGSIVGGPGSYLAPNSVDTGPYGAAFTELTAGDVQLTQPGNTVFVPTGPGQGSLLQVGQVFYWTESGVGRDLKVCIDWIVAPAGFGTVQSKLVTSATADLVSPVVMIDFGALPVASFFAGYRQIEGLPKSSAWQRFIGLQITTTGSLSAGKYVAWLGLDVDSVVMGYESSFTIK